jgi:hypothetical protein
MGGEQTMYDNTSFLMEDLLKYDEIMPVEEILHEDEFTGRVEILRELEEWVKEIGRVGAGSTSLIAPRRMGKTVLLDRLVNIVFFKPEYKVAPFYIKFKREEITLRKFLLVYASEFFRQYIAYCLQDPILYGRTDLDVRKLLQIESEKKAIKIVFYGLYCQIIFIVAVTSFVYFYTEHYIMNILLAGDLVSDFK